MATTPTNNPIPSEAITDLKFNAGKIDEFVNSDSEFYIDRFGVNRFTSQGIMNNLSPLGKAYTLEQAQAAIASGEIAEGAFFFVYSDDSKTIVEKYQNVASVATPTGVKMSSQAYINELSRRLAALESKTKLASQSREYFATAQDRDGNVLSYFHFGRLGAFGAASRLVSSIAKNLRISQHVQTSMKSLGDLILIKDKSGNVPLALKDGLIYGKGVHADTLKNSSLLNFTDGRTLWPYRTKVAKQEISNDQNIRVITVGDSWMEWKAIPQAIANFVYSRYGKGGDGWISFNIDGGTTTNNCLNNLSIEHNGFTVYDASNGSAPNAVIGCSHDGFALTSANQFATLQINGANCNTLRINYYDGDGTFNYRVDGAGDWIVVVGGNTKTKKFVDITGLPDGEHSLRINTTGNAGTVALYGFNADKPTGATLYKCGNGGMTTPMYSYVLPHIPHFVEYINPDVAIIIIGINDYWKSVSIDAFYAGYSDLIDSYRSVNKDMGIILISPPIPNATGATDMSVFNDAVRALAVRKNAEFYSGYEAFPKVWADGDAAGLWFNNLHLNNVGAQFLATQNTDKFL